MKSITFSCAASFSLTAEEIAAQILDLSNWPKFQGYGILPGIKSTQFEVKTPEVVGSKIRVHNRDGSSHLEEILQWDPQRQLKLRMHEFSPPLSRLATAFDEIWDFRCDNETTAVVRTLQLHAKSRLTLPLLWMISLLLRPAIKQHLNQMRVADRSA